MRKDIVKKALKKVTLEMVYEVVDERTREIKEELESIKRRQEEDFRFLNQKIDTLIGQVRDELKEEISQIRGEIKRLDEKIDRVNENVLQRMDMYHGQLRQEISQLNQRVDQLNQRMDTIIQLSFTLLTGRFAGEAVSKVAVEK